MAQFSANEWPKEVADWKINGCKPSIKYRGAAIAFHSTARYMCELDPWPNTTAAPVVVAVPGGAHSGTAQWNGPKCLNTPTIQINKHLDQRFTDEITYLELPVIQKYLAQ